MARNNDLVVTAGLNIEASVAQIEKDLKQVNDRLSADHALNIIANVDLSKTTQRIQSQLTTISKNLKLDIGGFTFDKNIDNAVSVIQNSLSNIKTGIKIPVDIDENAIENVSDSLKNLGLESKDIERLTKYFQDLDVAITKIKPKFVELAGSGGEKILDSLSISGVDRKTGGIINIVDQLDNIEGKTAKTTYTITQNLAKVEQENKKIEDSAKAAQLAYNDFLKLKGQADVYSKQYAGEDSLKTQLADIQKLIGEFDNTQPLEKQREGIINIDNALKLLKVDIDNIKKSSTPVITKGTSDFYPNIAKGTSTQDTISNAKNTLNELFAKTVGMEEDTANRVKRAVEDTTGALQRFYVQVERGDKSVETLTYALNEQGNAYEYLGKTIREADNSTDFRRKDITTQWDIQTQKLQQFITNAEKAGAASTVLSDDIANLKNKLNDKGDTSAMNSFLDDFDIAKAKFQAFNAEVRKDNAFANLQNRIKRLTADVNAYGEANKRATESMKQMSNGKTFAVEWSHITTEMAKGADLTDRELKDLSADMAVFRKEAQAAGLAGESAWGKFLNSFKTMSSYITANMVFNFAKRQLRDMVQEVTAVDTAMTELRKVTEATNAEFEAFAKSAGQTGRELGASISDVINATSTFSRAGYSLPDAEELGRIATLYKNVGDGINIDTASESLISVMKAFNIEAENSISVIDKINDVSNKAAIESGGLGLALQRVASAMKASQNTLDETIAIITASNEIVENPEMVANGWRTVALRIRGAKTELEQAGEDTEGMVESTAKLRELVKGISGVDIMLDENTFKSTYQIITEIGKVWHNISDINQASLLEAIAGRFYLNVQKCA